MTQNQPRLLLRKHSYYIRIFIPRKLQSVVKRKEIRYSLHTNNYFEALKKLRQESAKIDSWLEGLGNNEEDMELKDKKLNLTEEDANSLLLSRLDEIENYFIKQQDRLKIDKLKVLDISLFEEHLGMLKSPKINSNLYKLAILIKNLLRKTSQYLPDDAPEKEIFKNVKQTEIYVELEDINSPYTYGISEYVDFKALVQDKYFLEYLKNCFETEEYIEEKAKAIYKNKEYKSNNLKISNFVNILKQKELLKLEEHKLVKTHWKTVFKNMCSTDKAKTSKNTINKYEQLLNMVFSIIGKDKIENINFEDCSKFVSLIYKLPPKCKEKYPKLNIETAIQQNEAKNGDCIKIKTVIDHFRIFKELMAYAKFSKVIKENPFENFKTPKKNHNNDDSKIIDSFTPDELKKIFSKETYPSRYDRKNFYRFWIPLIALYHGARQSEIAQLQLDDIIKKDGYYCFNITDEGTEKSIKNKASRRTIPIHPTLIELGLVDFVKEIRKKKNKPNNRIFYTLTPDSRGKLNDKISSWFNTTYLKRLGLKTKSKNFHSFRHTFRSEAGRQIKNDNVIIRIGGWELPGMAKVYQHIGIPEMYNELKKLKYPINIQDLMPDPKQGIF